MLGSVSLDPEGTLERGSLFLQVGLDPGGGEALFCPSTPVRPAVGSMFVWPRFLLKPDVSPE